MQSKHVDKLGRHNRIQLEHLIGNKWLWIVEKVGKPIHTVLIIID